MFLPCETLVLFKWATVDVPLWECSPDTYLWDSTNRSFLVQLPASNLQRLSAGTRLTSPGFYISYGWCWWSTGAPAYGWALEDERWLTWSLFLITGVLDSDALSSTSDISKSSQSQYSQNICLVGVLKAQRWGWNKCMFRGGLIRGAKTDWWSWKTGGISKVKWMRRMTRAAAASSDEAPLWLENMLCDSFD